VPLRRGHLLAEALCALALAGVLAAAAATVLTGARRSLGAAERRDRAERAERETVAIARALLAGADGVVLRGDTAADFDQLLVTGIVCAMEPAALILAPAAPAGVASLLHVAQMPGPDDRVAVRLSGEEGRWWHAVVDSVQERTLPGLCAASDGWRDAAAADAPVIRISLMDVVPAEIRPGSVVRVGRRGRLTVYHAGSGNWMLGWRRCHPWFDVCGVVQPIAGPLRQPAALGFRLSALEGPPGLEIQARGANGGRGARGVVHW